MRAVAACVLLWSASAGAQEIGRRDEEATRQREWLRDERGFAGELWAGPTFRSFYGLPVAGVDLDMNLGGQRGVAAFYGGVGMMIGRTPAGLEVMNTRVDAMITGRPTRRLRLGGQLRTGLLGYRRATTDTMEWGYVLGTAFLASYDFYREESGHFAAFVGARAGVDLVLSKSEQPVPELGAALGIRFR